MLGSLSTLTNAVIRCSAVETQTRIVSPYALLRQSCISQLYRLSCGLFAHERLTLHRFPVPDKIINPDGHVNERIQHRLIVTTCQLSKDVII